MPTPCENKVHEKACVQVSIRLTPDVCIGEPKTYLIGNAREGACPCRAEESCVFTFRQDVCVKIPVTIDTQAEIAATRIHCEAFKDGIYPMEE